MQSIAPRREMVAPEPAKAGGPARGPDGDALSPFISLAEFGRMLGVKRNRANDLAAAGMIPTIRFGRRIFVPRRALEELADTAIADWRDRR